MDMKIEMQVKVGVEVKDNRNKKPVNKVIIISKLSDEVQEAGMSN